MTEIMQILVVDDNPDFCENVKDVLELDGHRVTVAHDGFEALDAVKRGRFDLVLMDIKMPVMNGVETFKKLKELAPSTPVIMVTAYAVEKLIKEALREGAFGTLHKPLDFDRLFDLIETATGEGAMVFVVDDDEALCANLQDIVEAEGYRVRVAYDSEAAIEHAYENNFDVMLLDMKLPPLNGLETYLAIRDIRPDATAIIITGFKDEMDDLVHQTIEKSAYTCLEKPIDFEQLFSLIERIGRQKAAGAIEKPEQ